MNTMNINVDDILIKINAIDNKLEQDIANVQQQLEEAKNELEINADADIANLKSSAQEQKDSEIEAATRLVDDENQMLITQLKNIS